ncbi:glucosaminidase domain-containing protein [Desulfosediminicola sp.]|uniref:glucosaminidase domain-containing protein n=1 Tax=Desulfosediminicola sp. TaxID=2886825 RepID=UPI003AF2D4DB
MDFQQNITRHIARFTTLVLVGCSLLMPAAVMSSTAGQPDHEILVHTGDVDEVIEYLKSRDFWGPESHAESLDVPRIILAIASDRWQAQSGKIDVQVKKELFYRVIVPMILLSNELIEKERSGLEAIKRDLEDGKSLLPAEQARIQALVKRYGATAVEDPAEQIDHLLQRVDIIPPSLALGQAAYESGYGTSRFAREGNALFGQWTYSGDGMKPAEHRAAKGNYSVAAYQWPLESVRSYMYNLNSHRAYQGLRDKRAALRKAGEKPTGLELAETLTSYSEKGEEYVNTLKGIISVNNLAIADKAYLRDEPLTLTVGMLDELKAQKAKEQIMSLRASGELDRILEEMRLDGLEHDSM